MIILGDSASFLVCAMCSMNIAWRCSCVLTALINPSLWHRPDVEVITANPKTAGVAWRRRRRGWLGGARRRPEPDPARRPGRGRRGGAAVCGDGRVLRPAA